MAMYFGRFNAPPDAFVVLIIGGLALLVCFGAWLILATIAEVLEHLIALSRRRSRHVADPPKCCGCGYDLRVSQFRCPECGRRINLPPSPAPRFQLYRGFVIVSSRREES
jgi:hypothetical protein